MQNECKPAAARRGEAITRPMTQPVYAFAEYRLDAAARELWRDGARVALPPKSFDCLVYLIDHQERAVGRDELISAVWGRADVSDALLAQTLLRARRAIGDTGDRQARIRTVPRFGYRWVGAFEVVPAPAADDASATAVPASARRRVVRRAGPLAIAAAALVLAGIALLLRHGPASRPATVAEEAEVVRPAIVVLPVEIEDGSAETAWIRLGVMDYVARRLRESGAFTVLPSAQVVALAGTHDPLGTADVEHIAAATQARWVVRPYMRRLGSGWLLRLVTGDGAREQEADGRAGHPLQAANLASDRLLARLGAEPGAESPSVPPGALAERIQRIDAALLAGDLDTARGLVDGAAPDQRADPALQVREAQIDFRAGREQAAAQRFAAIGRSEQRLPADVRAQALMGLGAVAVRRAEYATAEKRYAEALAVLGDTGDPNLVGNAYGGRGVARGAQSQVDRALSDLGRARIALDRAGNPLDAASVDTNWGLIESSRARFAQALPHFDRAIATFERFGVRDNLAASLLGKARAQLAMLDLDASLATSTRAWELARALENTTLLRNVAVAHADILLETGQLASAASVLRATPPGDDNVSDARVLLDARLALYHERPDLAEAMLRDLVAARPRDFDAVPVYVAAALASGQLDRARAAHDAAAQAQPSDAEARIALELAAARLALHDGDDARAGRAFAEAVRVADRSGVPRARVRAGTAYARYLIDRRRLDAASAVVGELAPYADREFRVARVTRDLYRALGDARLAEAAARRATDLAGERDPQRPPW